MNREINQIIMKTGKSKLLQGLTFGDTLIVVIGDIIPFNSTPFDVDFMTVGSFGEFYHYNWYTSEQNFMEHWEKLNGYDTIIFYSNESKAKNIKQVEEINIAIKLAKCVFMFDSEY